ncbi:MAG TPA: addiction module protein [Prolixibacteraceae bacterium]|nr:addiction module protein [Prolixibacteraceae bacterium]
MQDILKLSISERILMVEAIWDSIDEKDEQLELSTETKQLLDERLEAHINNPDEGSNWNDVKARIKKQF